MNRKATMKRVLPKTILPMILFKTVKDLTAHIDTMGSAKKTGFVPTMGALHHGHLSLIGESKQKTDRTVCSIFVNPTQFNDPQDFAKYPVTLDTDLLKLESAGCDIVFLPSVQEMYPDGTHLKKPFDLGDLENILEGKYRPRHFQGVCQVVNRLLEIVQPGLLFLGRKDYQQCMVIRKLIELKGYKTGLEIVPTLREPSGLAMSSRNRRLKDKDKLAAPAIYHSLIYIKQNLHTGVVTDLVAHAKEMILRAGFEKIDYVTVADAGTLLEISEWDGQTRLVVLAAAFIDSIRLIDNMALN